MSLKIEPTLLPFFKPRGVAIIGASHNPTKLGFGLARNLVQSGYSGAIHFVNPKGGVLLERPVYPSLAETPDPVDLAVLLAPAALVPALIEECGQRGLRAAIIAAGGFRETGPDGAALEADCLRVAQRYNIRLLGPNCLGLLDTHLPLDTTFLPPPGPPPGDVAFISHSGAICAAVIDWARGQGFGLSRLISLGNQADVCETDVLASVAADPHTRVITLYLEGVRDGQRFVAAAGRVTREKPIVALKVGRYGGGQQAVASHTGALAGREAAYDAAFRRSGVIRADTSEELFDWARALAWCPLPQGRRVAVLTNAGGPGVTAVDAIESHGLQLATLQPDTQQALGRQLPPAASLRNPVDMLAAATPEDYAHCLRLLLDDPGVDSVLVILPPPPMHAAGGVARVLIPTIFAARKPVVMALMGERMIQEAVEYFRAARVVEYRFPERAAAALAVLAQRAEYLATVPTQPERLTGIARRRARQALALDGAAAGEWLAAETVADLLTAYGIPTVPSRLACTPAEAVAHAEALGYPVALKIVAPTLPHKSDVGGVLLNLGDAAAVAAGMETILRQVAQAAPQAELRGVQVQPMIAAGQDVIIGVARDPQFGPLVMFGSGGVEVEGLKDVAFALAPLNRHEAQAMLTNTWAGRKLAGFRHLPPADREGTLDVLLRLAQLATDFPTVYEIEINPLRVLTQGCGVYALDVRARRGWSL